MIRRATIIVCIVILVLLTGCTDVSNKAADTNQIQSYQDITGITDAEIDAIEMLKESRSSFVYGQMPGVESFVLPNGSYAGFAAIFCDHLSLLFGIDFKLELYDWDTLSSGLDGMLIDFTGDLTPTPERMLHYYMTHPIVERSLRLFRHSDGTELLTEKDINGLKVGSLIGTVDLDRVNEYYPELTFTAVDVENLAAAARMLESGEIDVFIAEGVIDPFFDEYDYIRSKEFFPLVYTPASLTTANPDLRPIIDVVNKYLSTGGIDILFDFYLKGNDEYARNKLIKSFTEEERVYLQKLTAGDNSVKVALEQDNYPVSFYNTTDNEFQGIAVDVLARISKLTGIKFEAANDVNNSWSDILDMLKSGEVSLVSQLLQTEEREGLFLWPDSPYASAHYALISRSDFPNLAFYQVERTKVGTIADSAYEDKFTAWFHGNEENLITYNDQDELLDALENGEIDLLMGSNYLLLMQQNYRERPGFKINIRFSAPSDSYFGFNVDEAILCSIFSKAQSYVDTSSISADWTSRSYDYSKTLVQQRSRYYLVLASALAAVLILTVFFLVKNRIAHINLDKKVSEMTLDLRSSVAKLQAVISNYSGAIWSVDRDYNITLFDGLYLGVIGVKPDFLEGKSLYVAREKNRHLDIIENVESVFSGGGSQDWISEIDGKLFRSRISPIFDESENVIGVVGNVDDLTEMIRLQKDLETALEKAQSAVDAMKSAQLTVSAMFETNPQINVLFNKDFKVVDCNPAAVDFMGFETKEEMVDGFIERMIQSIPEYQSSGRPSISMPERMMTAAKEGFSRFETELVLGGTMKILDVEMKRIPYDDSFAVVAYVFDMTEIRERENELIRRDVQLQDAVMEAEEANKAKSAFLSTMSHEIRTPMNAILGITEIQLHNDSLDETVREALGKIFASGDLLLGIINDILDLSKIEAGKLELMLAKYEIASLVSDTAQLNMMRIGSKLIEFELFVDEEMPAYLLGDELRVKQILNNILSNAFKYTMEGTVKLSVSAEPAEIGDDKTTLVVSVSDTGQGMTQEQVDNLFDEYSRFNTEANRSTEGTGLGMSITRNLIHLMDGEIFIESELGKGSTFTIHLPQGLISDEKLGKEVADNLQQFRSSSRAQMKRVQITRDPMPYGSVLVVDDVETNIYVAKGLMIPYELTIDSTDSGFAAIERIKNGNEYDIIFMDHMMPQMDGIEATKIIRSMGYDRSIVALTANAVAGQADIFLKNGFDDFISKPIDVRQLNTVLNKLIRDKQPPDVIEAARKHAKMKQERTPEDTAQQAIDPRFAEIFVRDAMRVLSTLEVIAANNDYTDENQLRSYTINMHGIKTALANIDRMELSAVALKLEMAGREGKLDIITSDTVKFLNALRALTEELAPAPENENGVTTEDDTNFLRDKLLVVKTACEEYDANTADNAISELRDKPWSPPVKALINIISEHLLHSDFDEIVKALESY